jgi:hypothetical protein
VEVVGFKAPAPGAEDFRLDNGPDKLLKSHAVVGEKSFHACRGRAEYAQPTGGFLAENGAQPQVDAHGDQHGQGRAQELPNGQAEEYTFFVASDFFWNFYFYNDIPSFLKHIANILLVCYNHQKGVTCMSYFLNNNEQCEFKMIDGRLYLWVIHTDHSHMGMKPHVHILDLSELNLGQTEVEQEINIYCGMAKESGRVEPYPYYGA